MMRKEIISFQEDLKKFDIYLEQKQIDQFLEFYELLIKWNSFMNLTSITEFSEVIKKHYVDSISLVKAIPDLTEKQYSLIDVGTGAGFPGIPLKIVFPELKITLLDSLNKRVQFLNEVICLLNLNQIDAIHGRAEDFAKPGRLRESYDICVSRAVANLSVLAEYCIPFVKKNGYFVAYKSEKILEEYESAKKALDILGGGSVNQIEFELPNSDINRILLVVKKKWIDAFKVSSKVGNSFKRTDFLIIRDFSYLHI